MEPMEPARSPAESNHPALVAGRERRASLHPVRGRWLAMSTVVIVVAAVALFSALFPPSSAAPAPGLLDAVGVPPTAAYSTSAFCTAGSGTTAASTIYLTNSTAGMATGVMTTVGQATASGSVPTVRRSVSVPAHGNAAVNPASGLPAGDTATTVVFDGGGVVASQVVSGSDGWSSAPCASQPSAQWSFAGGDTTTGNGLTLSLLNPSSTEAVVNVSFLTSAGRVTPQAYQGLVVPPGQLVVEQVGDYVQSASAIATFVVAQAGDVVANEFQRVSSGATGGVALRLGAPSLSTTWRFAQSMTVGTSVVAFTLANPTNATVNATITIGLASGSVVPRQVPIPPQSTSVYSASGASGLPKSVPFSVTVTSPQPIVVGRSVQAPEGATPPVWGASAGTVTAADHWLVPGPGVPHAPGTAGATVDTLAVANPGSSPARVTVAALGSNRPVAVMTVGPGQLMVLGSKLVGGLSTFTVSSTSPVNVEEDSGPSGAPGVVSSSGFPFAD